MREVEEERRRASLPPLKYHGKWPFLRVLGVQEPVSAATSLANAAAHAHGYARLRRAWQARAFPLRTLWGCYAALCLNAWAWSTVFHCRDTHATERLDYLSAIALLVFALFAACVRALRLFRLAQWLPLGLGLGCGLALHCFAMLFVKFDYGANVAVRPHCFRLSTPVHTAAQLGIAAGISQSVVLVAWTQAAKHPHRWRLLALIVAVHAASLLEVLDFPPLVGLLDAHACWHAATPALALAWWSFVEDDMRSFWPTGKGT